MSKGLKTALIVGGVVVALLVLASAVFGQFWGGRNYGYGMMGGYGWGGLMGLGMVVFWGLVIWGVVALARGNAGSTQADSPHEILKKRYARGEINKAEYEEKKKDLT